MGLFRSKVGKKREKAARLLEEQATAAKARAEAGREVTAEARPNPDQPGWGQITGQAIVRAREDRASQE